MAEPRHDDDAAVAEPRHEFDIYGDDMDAPPPCLKTSTSLTLTWELMVTKAAHAHQCAAWKVIFDKLVAEQRHPWLIVARAWDETVMTLSFSKPTAAIQLRWSLMRLARKLGMNADQTTRLSQTLSVANSGPCQVMVQRLIVKWAAGSGAEFFVPPVSLAHNNAVCMSKALDRSLDIFSLSELRRMASHHVGWIALIYVKDGLFANAKLATMHQEQLLPNMFLFEVTCMIHAVCIPLKYLLAFGNHVSPLFCAGRLLCIPAQVTRLTRAIWRILRREPRYVPAASPAEAEPRTAEAEPRTNFQTFALELTLLREALLTRSAVSSAQPLPPKKTTNWDSIEAAAHELTTMFNGDWLSSQICHQCTPACDCRSTDDTVESATAALCHALLARLPQPLAMSKWTTVQDNVQWWTLGFVQFD